MGAILHYYVCADRCVDIKDKSPKHISMPAVRRLAKIERGSLGVTPKFLIDDQFERVNIFNDGVHHGGARVSARRHASRIEPGPGGPRALSAGSAGTPPWHGVPQGTALCAGPGGWAGCGGEARCAGCGGVGQRGQGRAGGRRKVRLLEPAGAAGAGSAALVAAQAGRGGQRPTQATREATAVIHLCFIPVGTPTTTTNRCRPRGSWPTGHQPNAATAGGAKAQLDSR